MKLINTNLLTPGNAIAIGAIVFFWVSVAFFLREAHSLGSTTSTKDA